MSCDVIVTVTCSTYLLEVSWELTEVRNGREVTAVLGVVLESTQHKDTVSLHNTRTQSNTHIHLACEFW